MTNNISVFVNGNQRVGFCETSPMQAALAAVERMTPKGELVGDKEFWENPKPDSMGAEKDAENLLKHLIDSKAISEFDGPNCIRVFKTALLAQRRTGRKETEEREANG